MAIPARRSQAPDMKNPGRVMLRGLSVRISCDPDISAIRLIFLFDPAVKLRAGGAAQVEERTDSAPSPAGRSASRPPFERPISWPPGRSYCAWTARPGRTPLRQRSLESILIPCRPLLGYPSRPPAKIDVYYVLVVIVGIVIVFDENRAPVSMVPQNVFRATMHAEHVHNERFDHVLQLPVLPGRR